MTGAVVIITGGGGFLGQCLAKALLEQGTVVVNDKDKTVPIEKLVLTDIRFPESMLHDVLNQDTTTITKIVGDVSDADFVTRLYEQAADHVSVFHLGAIMSGDGERDFDLCVRVNLYGTLHLLEGARKLKTSCTPKLVFCSAGAIVGAGAETDYVSVDSELNDSIRATPHTTYGMTKACCELLASDYARRDMVDARGLRLPTVVVRAGAPNGATTGCFSAVVRDAVAKSKSPVQLPVAAEVKHAVTGARNAVGALMALHNAHKETVESVLGFDRTIFCPAIPVSLGDLQEALNEVITPESRAHLAPIEYNVDEKLSAIVGSFPTNINATRARQLGIPDAPTPHELVRHYLQDFPSAVADGIQLLKETTETTAATTKPSERKVAVITGGGTGIGRAVAERLFRGGWNVVLAGRRSAPLKETQMALFESAYDTPDCLCVPTDVSIPTQVESLFQTVQQKFGRCDLLFNNAGINCAAASVEQVNVEDFERIMKINVHGPFLCARAAMKLMGSTGGGRIINNGSISAHTPRPGSAPYTTSKHALNGLTKCIALDGRALNVACGQIDFGNIVSELSNATNKAGSGALQANGTSFVEPSMSLTDAAEAVWTMASLPLEANVLQMTLMATQMPFVGRG